MRFRAIADRAWRKARAGSQNPDWVTAIASAVSALAIVWAAVVYVHDWWSTVTLTADPPLIVELRCSRTDFDPTRCMSTQHSNESFLSITAALRITAEGSSQHTAVIGQADAEIRFGPKDGGFGGGSAIRRTLRAFWAANLTPGHEDQRQQIVPLALAGGQSTSREIWFMPVAVPCGDKPVEDKGCGERDDFYPWENAYQAIGDRSRLADSATLNPEKKVHIIFNLYSRDDSGRAIPLKPTTCTGVLGRSVRWQFEHAEEDSKQCGDSVSPDYGPVAGPSSGGQCLRDPRRLSFTIACEEAFEAKRPPDPSWLRALWNAICTCGAKVPSDR